MDTKTGFDTEVAHQAILGLLEPEGLAASPEIEFSGGDPCFDSPYLCAEAPSAVLAATAVAASDLATMRSQQRVGHVGVDTRLAEASLASFAFQSFADQARSPQARISPEDRTATAGFFTCNDGRSVYIHSSFPGSDHAQAVLDLLGVSPERDAVTAAIAHLSAPQLEQDLADAGLCGAMVRTSDEWDDSTAGRALAAVPVVEVIKIGDGPPRDLIGNSSAADAARALAGLRVLDLTRVLAGPTCARALGSMGAEVLQIRGEGLPNVEAFVADTGIGKKSAYLDLKADGDKNALRALVRKANVFSQGYRSGVMDRLGFGVDQIVDMNPGIIYVSINCYGHEGDWKQRPGWEQLAQVVTGMATRQGEYLRTDDAPVVPTLQPSALNDYTTGYLGALGVVLAKRRQLNEGGAYLVRVSLCRTAMWVRSLGERSQPVEARTPDIDDFKAWCQSFDTYWGPLDALRPPISLDGTPMRWLSPPVPLGTNAPRFN